MGVIARHAVRDAERCGFHQGQRQLTPPHQQVGYMTAYLTLPHAIVPLATEGPSIHGSVSRLILCEALDLAATSTLKRWTERSLSQNNKKIVGRVPGYIYGLKNESYRGLVKIGKTQRSAPERVKELSTAAPKEFSIAFSIQCNNIDLAESFIHKILRPLNENKEYFLIDAIVAERFSRQVCAFVNNIVDDIESDHSTHGAAKLHIDAICSKCNAKYSNMDPSRIRETKGQMICVHCGHEWRIAY
jgi:RNase P subunit RPR2